MYISHKHDKAYSCVPGLVLAHPHALVRSHSAAEVHKIGSNRLSRISSIPCTQETVLTTCGSLIYSSLAGNLEACDMLGSSVQQISVPSVHLQLHLLQTSSMHLFPKVLSVQVYGSPTLMAATVGHPGKLAALTSASHVVTWDLSHQGLCKWPVPTKIDLQGCKADSLACNAEGSQARFSFAVKSR